MVGRKEELKTLWECPQCRTTVKQRYRKTTDKDTGRTRTTMYFACPNAYHRNATSDYSISPQGMERYAQGKGTIRSCGSGTVFREYIVGDVQEDAA